MEIDFDPLEHLDNGNILLDVRSPSEFELGHIPGAISVPLFSDEERAEVGTIYKRQSKEEAVLRGLEIVGPKMAPMVKEIVSKSSGQSITVYCWRGGMRSGSVELLLNTLGLKANRINGGYKGFRTWAHNAIQKVPEYAQLKVISGMTGSGKTEILHELRAMGEQIIDLEGLANHRGSAFGHLLQQPQPSTEHFINKLAIAIYQLDASKTIWIEDESRLVGKVVLPDPIYTAIQNAPHHVIQLPTNRRLDWLEEEYGNAPKDQIFEAFTAIKKRLGGLRWKEAMEAVEQGNAREAAEKALSYYDSAYSHALDVAKKDGCSIVKHTYINEGFEAIAKDLINEIENH